MNQSLNFSKGKLNKTPYALLPSGAVMPEGWLYDQLCLQRDGISSDMELYPDYAPATSEWRGGVGENWERGPYYLRGLVALAYTLDDEKLIERAQSWIDCILESQNEQGMFGPTSNTDWWSRMPVLMALRDYLEALEYRGKDDPRVIPFMEKYFRYQHATLPEKPLHDWARARGGDNVDSAFWLYNRLYNKDDPKATDWLLEVACRLISQTQDWSTIMNETTVREHVVNTSQAMKTPPLKSLITGDGYDIGALKRGLFNMFIDHGRIDELPNSDEAARDNLSTRGSELCSIVEGMLSTEIAMCILGEPWLGDRLETLAYNALPAGYAPDYSGHVYYILQNQVMATTGFHEFDCDHGDSSAFGGPCGFDCCFSNNHMGWPKFVRSMWLATEDDGLAAFCYGPCSVKAKVADGKIASFTEATEYPFRNSVKLTYNGENAAFRLALRIPKWAKSASVTVGGMSYAAIPDTFFDLTRDWMAGDVVEIEFADEIKVSEWYNRSVAVTKGPLIYSLAIDEDWREYADNSTRELKVEALGNVKNHEVYPLSRWNYGLVVDEDILAEYFPVSKQPFDYQNAPVVLHAKGQMIPGWKLDGNKSGVQPYGGTLHEPGAECDIKLVPYGSARLKITHFPAVKDDCLQNVWNKPEYSVENGQSVTTFSGICLTKARDYALLIDPADDTPYEMYYNGKKVEVQDNKVESLKACSEFADHGFYQNFRFVGGKINFIEIVPVDAVESICVETADVDGTTVSVRVNFDRRFSPYDVDWGYESCALSNHVSGFRSDVAKIDGIEPDCDVYLRVNAMLGGKRVSSEVCKVHTGAAKSASLSSIQADAESAFECVQVIYSKVDGAQYYSIDFGSTSGYYPNTVTDIIFNPYKGSTPFTKDKCAFTFTGTTCYLRINAWCDGKLVARSDEISVRLNNKILR